jgi:hypothetical protein
MTVFLMDRALPAAPVAAPAERGWPIVFICWAALAFAWSFPNLASLSAFTGSTDDTMRLVQVRAFLDGAGWYGLHEARLDPPFGLDSHWSRLIDLPIALLILIGRPFFGLVGAEIFAMIAWPASVHLATMIGFVLIGLRLAPKAGPIPMIAAFIACLPVMGYFKPLAIDHHNVQMALAMLLVAAAVWSAERKAAAILGGICAVFVTAIGFESLHVLAAIEALVLGLAVFGSAEHRRGAMLWFLAQGLAILPVYLINTPPAWWLNTGCDALQLNMAAMIGAGSLGIAALLHAGSGLSRLALLAASGLIGGCALILGIFLDPACIAGPNARVAPEAISLWMRYVEEAQPWAALLGFRPNQALIFMAYPALALACAGLLAWRKKLDASILVLLAAMLAATLIMLTQVRGFTYAAILGGIIVAVTGARLFENGRFAPVMRILFAAALPVFAVLAISAAVKPAPNGAATASTEAEMRRDEEYCAARAGFGPLQNEPAGLVLGHIDIGPAMLLNTHHQVLMAPYHRADRGIVEGFKLMATPLGEAEKLLRARGVRYLADCTKLGDAIDRKTTPEPLRDAILGKIDAAWLERLPADPAFPHMRFWKIKP